MIEQIHTQFQILSWLALESLNKDPENVAVVVQGDEEQKNQKIVEMELLTALELQVQLVMGCSTNFLDSSGLAVKNREFSLLDPDRLKTCHVKIEMNRYKNNNVNNSSKTKDIQRYHNRTYRVIISRYKYTQSETHT